VRFGKLQTRLEHRVSYGTATVGMTGRRIVTVGRVRVFMVKLFPNYALPEHIKRKGVLRFIDR